jgi:hypothetical protein
VEWLKKADGTYMKFNSVEHAKYVLKKFHTYSKYSDEELGTFFEFIEVYDYENQL